MIEQIGTCNVPLMQNYQTQNFQIWKEVFSNKIGGVLWHTKIRSGVSNQELDKRRSNRSKVTPTASNSASSSHLVLKTGSKLSLTLK